MLFDGGMAASTLARDLLTLTEAAAELGKSERTLRRLVAAGRLEPVRLADRVFVRRSDVDRMVAPQLEGADTARERLPHRPP